MSFSSNETSAVNPAGLSYLVPKLRLGNALPRSSTSSSGGLFVEVPKLELGNQVLGNQEGEGDGWPEVAKLELGNEGAEWVGAKRVHIQSVVTSISPGWPASLRALEYRQWSGSST